MTEKLNATYLKMLPRFNLETISVGDFIIIKIDTGKVEVNPYRPIVIESPTIYFNAAVQVTAVRDDELLVRVVEVLAGDPYFKIHQCAYVAGDSVTLRPEDVHNGIVEIWPAKAVIPGM